MPRRALWLLLAIPFAVPLIALAAAGLSVSPQDLAFDTRCVRTSARSSPVTITNPANGHEARDVEVAIDPTVEAGAFPLSGATSVPTLQPGRDVRFRVGFVPQRAGDQSAKAVVTYTEVSPGPTPSPKNSNQPTESPSPSLIPRKRTVTVSGSGIDRFIDTSPKTLNFGDLRVGKPAEREMVQVYDDGDSSLHISSVTIEGPEAGDFSVRPTRATTVRDGSPWRLSVGFEPSKVGARLAELVIHSDSCIDPIIRVPLAGIGVEPDIIALPTELDLGERRAERGTRRGLTVANQGGYRLKITDMRLGGLDMENFKLLGVGTFPRVLDPGEALDFRVAFAGVEPGEKRAVVRVRSNDPDTKVLRIKLFAVVQEPEASPTPSVEPSVAPPEAPPSGGSGFAFGRFAQEAAVAGGVVGFFLALVLVRRMRGVPE
jgi:hypothetical protein